VSDQPSVELTTDNGTKGQFGKFLKYRSGKPRKKSVVVISVGIFAVVVIALLLSGGPEQEAVGTSGIDVPAVTAAQPVVNLPEYDRNKDILTQEENEKNARTGSRGGVAIKLTGPQLVKRPRGVKIPPGVLVKGQLLSGASNGLVKAKLLEAVVIDGERLVEPGTIAMGNGSSTEERLFVKFSKLIYRDGTLDSIQADACDESDKTPGLKGSKVGQYALKLAAGIGLNFAGGLAEGLQETQGQQGALVKPPTVKNALLNGASRAALEQSRDTMSDLKSKQPLIEVPEQTEIYILFGDQ